MGDSVTELFDLIESAELVGGAATRVSFARTFGDILGHQPLDVIAQLGVEPALEGIAPGKSPQPVYLCLDLRHIHG
jgi:hypothetical protein